jgi:uncharacterized metal-binding protein YceD (DUF177 family)
MERTMTDRRHIRLADLPTGRPTPVRIEPDAAELAAMAETLELLGLRKVRLEGELRPRGKRDWDLVAHLGATVVQPCVVTLAPVTTRIEEPVERRFRAELPEPLPGAEVEMPEDDALEPLPETLDLARVLTEALALAVPEYPRADGASLGEAVFTMPGAAPMTDAEARPFAGLARLRDRLKPED